MVFDGCHSSRFSICVLTVISEERVPSNFKELLLDVLFLLISESSPAFKCGIVITASATLKRRSNSNKFVPGFFTPCKKPQRTSMRCGSSSERFTQSFTTLEIASSGKSFQFINFHSRKYMLVLENKIFNTRKAFL